MVLAVTSALGTALVAPTAAEQRDVSIVVLAAGESAPYREVTRGFQEYLAAYGLGGTVDVYTMTNRDDAGSPVLDRIRRDPPSLLLTLGIAATRLALAEASEVPVVAAMLFDMEPVAQAQNATGVSLRFSPEVSFTWLTRILPDHEAVGVLYDPAENQTTVEAAEPIAATLNLKLQGEKVTSPRDLQHAVDQLARRTDVLWGIPDRTVLSPQTAQHVLLFSFRHRLPFVGLSAEWVKAGALYALDRDYRDIGTQSGELAAKILSGTPPHALPPQTPRKVVYDINLKTAHKLQITLSGEVISGARTVIQ